MRWQSYGSHNQSCKYLWVKRQNRLGKLVCCIIVHKLDWVKLVCYILLPNKRLVRGGWRVSASRHTYYQLTSPTVQVTLALSSHKYKYMKVKV